MTDPFTNARRKRIEDSFKTAAKDLIEFDSIPFEQVTFVMEARGEKVTVTLRVEKIGIEEPGRGLWRSGFE